MKPKLTICLFVMLLPVWGWGQNCYDYPCVIRKVKEALFAKNYQSAFDNLESAAAYPDSQAEEIAGLRQQLFDSIQQEKDQAESERQRAEQAENRVRNTLKIVQQERDRSDALRKEAEKNSEINRLTAQALEIQPEDPGLAAKLAHYAFQLSGRQHPLAAKIRRNIYEDPTALLLTAELIGHQGEVTALAFSPNGQYLVTGSRDHTAILWDLNGRILQHFTGHTANVTQVVFTPDSHHLITGSADNTLKLWDLQGEELRTFYGHTGSITHISFSSDGKLLLSEGRDGLKLWEIEGRMLTERFENNDRGLEAVSFMEKNRKIVGVNTYGAVTVWDLEGKLLNQVNMEVDDLLIAEFSQDGARLLVNSVGRKTLLWQTATNALERELPGNSMFRVAGFSVVDDHILIARTKGEVEAWELSGRKKGPTLHLGSKHSLARGAFSSDGRWLVSAGAGGSAKLWCLSRGDVLRLGEHQAGVSTVAFHPEGEFMATAGKDQQVLLWDQQGHVLHRLSGHERAVRSVAFSPDGKWLLSGSLDRSAKLWDRNGQLVRTFPEHEYGITEVRFFPDGQSILTVAGSELVRRDLKGNLLLKYNAPFNIAGLDISSDGTQLALTGGEGIVLRLSSGGKLLKTFQTDPYDIHYAIAFSPDGTRLLLGSNEGKVALLELEGRIIQQFSGFSASVYTVAFSPACVSCTTEAGQLIAAGGQDGIILWDRQGQEVQRFSTGTATVTDLSFAPDGKSLLAGRDDHMATRFENLEAYFGGLRDFYYAESLTYSLPFDYREIDKPGLILDYGLRYLQLQAHQPGILKELSLPVLDSARQVMDLLVERFGEGYQVYQEEVLYNYARYYFRNGAFPEAIAAYEKVIAFEPSNEWINLELATTLLFAGDWERTKAIYDQWLGKKWDLKVSLYARSWDEAFYKYLKEAREIVAPKDTELVKKAVQYLLEAMSQ